MMANPFGPLRPQYVAIALALCVTGCVTLALQSQQHVHAAVPQACPRLPETDLRPDLPADFVDICGQVRWPPAQGFNPAELQVIVQPKDELDRFGDANGHFVSPKGELYDRRALPYVCQAKPYTVYRVKQAFTARLGTAAPWFGAPGGAVQLETTATVQQLLDAKTIEAEPGPQTPPC
jgi:hypothetical protein